MTTMVVIWATGIAIKKRGLREELFKQADITENLITSFSCLFPRSNLDFYGFSEQSFEGL